MQNTPLVIQDQSVPPGERDILMLPLPELYDGSPMYMPVHVVCGKEAGPTLVVLAAIHGDEINGIEIIHRLLKLKLVNQVKGKLIVIPIANNYGFILKTRYLMDRRDLNRSFPGSKKGSIAARLAHFLLDSILNQATHVIDLHTASFHRINIPQIRATLKTNTIKSLAKSFAAPVILDTPVLKGSLRESMNARDIPYLVYEAGEALRFDELSITLGVKGIVGVMRHIHMLKETRVSKTVQTTIAYSSKWIRANYSGLMTLEKKLGQKVERNELLGHITDPMTLHEFAIHSPISGVIIGMTQLPMIHEGEALFHIASVRKPKQAADHIADLEEYYDREQTPNE